MSSYNDYEFYEQEERGKKGIWKIVAIVVAIVLVLAAVVGVLVVALKPKTENTVNYIQEGLEMYDEPELRLDDPQGIRFKATVSPELKKEVESDENKSFGFVIAPLTYFLKVDIDGELKEVDWLKRFETESMVVLTLDDCAIVSKAEPNGTPTEHFIQGSITNILYKNTNLEFMAFAYVKTMDGENVSYKYASYPERVSYKTQSRSLAYLTAEALNDKTVNFTYYSAADVELMKGFINNSVDYANGLEEATADGSIYTVTLSETEKIMKVGDEFTLAVDIAESVKVPIWWTTSDTTVATVNNGVITATGIGSTTITAYIAGTEYTCVITVTETGAAVAEQNTDNASENGDGNTEVAE